MGIKRFSDFLDEQNKAGSTIQQPGNPQSGLTGPGPQPVPGASQEPFQPSRIEPSNLPASSGQASPPQSAPNSSSDSSAPSGPPSPSSVSSSQSSQSNGDQNSQGTQGLKTFADFLSDAQKGIGQGVNPNSPYAAGSIQNPINQNPLSDSDYVRQSVGNSDGILGYLKKKFGDATLDPKQGLMIQSGGQWYKAGDAPGIGAIASDAWDLTKKVFGQAQVDKYNSYMDNLKSGSSKLGSDTKKFAESNAYDLGVTYPAMAAGAAEGAALGSPLGPLGAAAGGIAGAGLAGLGTGSIKTLLGRALGTFDASPADTANDIGMEALMNMGAETVGLGAKPALSQLVKAGSFIKGQANDITKSLISNTMGGITGAGAPAINAVIEDGSGVASKVKIAANASENAAQMKDFTGNKKITSANQLLQSATDALPNKYGELLNNLIDSADSKNLTVNVGNVASNAIQSIEDKGFGQIVKQGSDYSFKPFSPQDLADRASKGLPTEILDDSSASAISDVVNKLNGFSKIGEVQGSAAAKVLTGLNKAMNQTSKDAMKGAQNNPAYVRALSAATNGFRDGVADAFDKAGLGDQYNQMQGIYSEFANSVNKARTTLNNDGAEAFVNKLTSAAGKNLTAKGDAQLLVSLAGDDGQDMYRNIVQWDAAQKLSPWAPKFGLFKPIVGGEIAGTSVGMPLAGAAAGAASIPFSSPRVAMQGVRAGTATLNGLSAMSEPVINYMMQAKDFLSGTSRLGMSQLLKDPHALGAVLTTPVQAAQQENQDTMSLLQKGGVIKNGQQ